MVFRAKKRLHFFLALRNVWFCKRRMTAVTDVTLIRRLTLNCKENGWRKNWKPSN